MNYTNASVWEYNWFSRKRAEWLNNQDGLTTVRVVRQGRFTALLERLFGKWLNLDYSHEETRKFTVKTSYLDLTDCEKRTCSAVLSIILSTIQGKQNAITAKHTQLQSNAHILAVHLKNLPLQTEAPLLLKRVEELADDIKKTPLNSQVEDVTLQSSNIEAEEVKISEWECELAACTASFHDHLNHAFQSVCKDLAEAEVFKQKPLSLKLADLSLAIQVEPAVKPDPVPPPEPILDPEPVVEDPIVEPDPTPIPTDKTAWYEGLELSGYRPDANGLRNLHSIIARSASELFPLSQTFANEYKDTLTLAEIVDLLKRSSQEPSAKVLAGELAELVEQQLKEMEKTWQALNYLCDPDNEIKFEENHPVYGFQLRKLKVAVYQNERQEALAAWNPLYYRSLFNPAGVPLIGKAIRDMLDRRWPNFMPLDNLTLREKLLSIPFKDLQSVGDSWCKVVNELYAQAKAHTQLSKNTYDLFRKVEQIKEKAMGEWLKKWPFQFDKALIHVPVMIREIAQQWPSICREKPEIIKKWVLSWENKLAALETRPSMEPYDQLAMFDMVQMNDDLANYYYALRNGIINKSLAPAKEFISNMRRAFSDDAWLKHQPKWLRLFKGSSIQKQLDALEKLCRQLDSTESRAAFGSPESQIAAIENRCLEIAGVYADYTIRACKEEWIPFEKITISSLLNITGRWEFDHDRFMRRLKEEKRLLNNSLKQSDPIQAINRHIAEVQALYFRFRPNGVLKDSPLSSPRFATDFVERVLSWETRPYIREFWIEQIEKVKTILCDDRRSNIDYFGALLLLNLFKKEMALTSGTASLSEFLKEHYAKGLKKGLKELLDKMKLLDPVSAAIDERKVNRIPKIKLGTFDASFMESVKDSVLQHFYASSDGFDKIVAEVRDSVQIEPLRMYLQAHNDLVDRCQKDAFDLFEQLLEDAQKVYNLDPNQKIDRLPFGLHSFQPIIDSLSAETLQGISEESDSALDIENLHSFLSAVEEGQENMRLESELLEKKKEYLRIMQPLLFKLEKLKERGKLTQAKEISDYLKQISEELNQVHQKYQKTSLPGPALDWSGVENIFGDEQESGRAYIEGQTECYTRSLARLNILLETPERLFTEEMCLTAGNRQLHMQIASTHSNWLKQEYGNVVKRAASACDLGKYKEAGMLSHSLFEKIEDTKRELIEAINDLHPSIMQSNYTRDYEGEMKSKERALKDAIQNARKGIAKELKKKTYLDIDRLFKPSYPTAAQALRDAAKAWLSKLIREEDYSKDFDQVYKAVYDRLDILKKAMNRAVSKDSKNGAVLSPKVVSRFEKDFEEKDSYALYQAAKEDFYRKNHVPDSEKPSVESLFQSNYERWRRISGFTFKISELNTLFEKAREQISRIKKLPDISKIELLSRIFAPYKDKLDYSRTLVEQRQVFDQDFRVFEAIVRAFGCEASNESLAEYLYL